MELGYISIFCKAYLLPGIVSKVSQVSILQQSPELQETVYIRKKQLICTQRGISVVTNPRATPALVVILPGYFWSRANWNLLCVYQQLLFCCGVFRLPKSNNRVKTTRIEDQDYKNWRSRLQELKIKTTRVGDQDNKQDQDYKIRSRLQDKNTTITKEVCWTYLVVLTSWLWTYLVVTTANN